MKEYIGKVCLDDTYYPGEDLYSDGAVEDEMLKLSMEVEEEEFNREIDRRKSWPILYHFSHIRENIANWLPLKDTDRVLEVGAGCGAVTGALASRAGHVTCIDLSRKRSLMNAHRHKNYDNVEILMGNFQDIEASLTEKYDYITLIGVFEYSEGYIGGQEPYVEMLRKITAHLKPQGKIVIAIENRLGLKYWAGCTEDHNGQFFEGLEGYPTTSGVRTFSRKELETIFETAGSYTWDFYYPYPDYKFPMTIYSDKWLPGIGELREVRYNFDRARLRLFDETRVYDTLIANDLYPVYANSFLVLLSVKDQGQSDIHGKTAEQQAREALSGAAARLQESKKEPEEKTAEAGDGEAQIQQQEMDGPSGKAGESSVQEPESPGKESVSQEKQEEPGQIIYVKHSNERDPRFAIRTEIYEDGSGKRTVRKVAETPAAEAHISRIHKSYQLLKGLYRNTAIEMNRCWKGNGYVTLEYVTGTTLEEMLDALLENQQTDQLWETLNSYLDVIRSAGEDRKFFVKTDRFREVFGDPELPAGLRATDVANVDCICSNLLWDREKEKWQMLDYEWTFAFPVPVNFLIYRILNYYLFTSTMRAPLAEGNYFAKAGLTPEECQAYEQMEVHFQKYITGSLVPMRDMYDAISPGILIDLKSGSWEKQCFSDCLQVFVDYGEDFSEENSWLLPCQEGFYSGIISIPEGAKRVRLDPTDKCCIVKLRCLRAEKVPGGISLDKKILDQDFLPFTTNGWEYGTGAYFFNTRDPQFVLEELPADTSEIAFAYEVTACSDEVARMIQSQMEEKRRMETELAVCRQELKQKKELIQAMENTKVWKLYRTIKKD